MAKKKPKDTRRARAIWALRAYMQTDATDDKEPDILLMAYSLIEDLAYYCRQKKAAESIIAAVAAEYLLKQASRRK